MKPVLAGVCAALLLCNARLGVGEDRPWTEARSAHFTVVSDDSANTARDFAWQFEQVRAAIDLLWPWARLDLPRPVLVLAARDEASLKVLAPQYWEKRTDIHPASVAAGGVDRYYIAVRSDAKADDQQGTVNPYLTAYWSYTSVVLSNGFRQDLPLWFSRGLANLMANTIVRDSSLQLGRIVPWYLQRLRSGARLPLRELILADRTSAWYTDPARLEVLDAESWAFVHYLLFAEDGSHRTQLDRFASLLFEGKTAAAASEAAFGSLDKLENGFNIYFNQPLFPYATIKVDVNIKKADSTSRSVSLAEAAADRAAFLAATARPVEARAAIEEARKGDPKLAAHYEVEGVLLDVERKSDEARTVWGKAIELESTNYYAYYRWSSLNVNAQTTPEVRSRAEQALARATTLNDAFAPAYSLLAFVRAQAGRADQALVPAERAVMLEPSQVQNRLMLARVLAMLSRRDDARKAALDAREFATTDAERSAIQAFLD